MDTNEGTDSLFEITDESKSLAVDEWFVPHFPPLEDRPLQIIMCSLWKNYASYQDDFNGYYLTRIDAMMHKVPRVRNLRGGRTASTFMLWSTTNNGRSFLHQLYRDQREVSSLGFYFKERSAIKTLAIENRLSGHWGNILNRVLCNEKSESVYNDPSYPTLEDYRVVEMLCIFFVSNEGMKFLYRVYKKAKQLDLLHFKKEDFKQ